VNIVLWVIAGLLAAAFAASGLMKLTQPKEKLATNGPWVEDFPLVTVRAIGALEVLAAVGPVLVPLAALGLVLLMAGAAITHLRRHETSVLPINAVLLILAAIVVWGRFGPYSF
jgi:uncharacterized membrane protein YphA (DoxX/SURF4 family)